MKREGRQHGMVQTYPIVQVPWNPRRGSNLASPAATTAGFFARVSQKPTNHSKFTGRCGRPRCADCHTLPAGKSKDKAKGSRRLKSCDVVANYRLVTWRVVDPRPGLKFTGLSATGILDHLANDCAYDYDNYGDEIDDASPYDDGTGDGVYDYGYGADSAIASTSFAIEDLDEFDGDDDENMSFCDVGFMWEQVEVEGDVDGWCLVEEI